MEEPIVNDMLNDNCMEKEISDDNYVLSLCPIPETVNKEKLKEYVSKDIESRIEYYEDTKKNLTIEDHFSEWCLAKSTDGVQIGGGHCAMDVKTKNNEGIDATCLVMNKNMTNEKSLIQNFQESGKNLDVLFNEKKTEEAVSLFMNDYEKKLENVKKVKELNDLYILAYISTFSEVYIACFKINISKISSVTSGGFVNDKKDNNVNIIVNNFIDPDIGKVNLYKSKKRVELRLKKELLEKDYVEKIYTKNKLV